MKSLLLLCAAFLWSACSAQSGDGRLELLPPAHTPLLCPDRFRVNGVQRYGRDADGRGEREGGQGGVVLPEPVVERLRRPVGC